MSISGEEKSIWDRYWQADRIASCFDSPGQSYDEALLQDWRVFFSALPEKARILDLCTGNGAVVIVAAEIAAGAAHPADHFHIEAVDQADIDPAGFVTSKKAELAAITFHPRTPVEALPFDDGAYSAITSQYGIEYSDMQASLAEAVRVLAPGGRLRFVCHAAEGVVVQNTRRGMADCRYLLRESGLFKAASTVLQTVWPLEQNRTQPTRARRTRAEKDVRRFQAALEKTRTRMKTAYDTAMYENAALVLADTFNKRDHFTLPVLLDQVQLVQSEISAHLGRLQALDKAALSETRISALEQQLQALGMKELCHAGIRHGDSDRLVGWEITGISG
jgi:ubiquinone/menaquinone biosynthesis C-methylase UbiE